MIIHDLRSPLTAVTTSLKLMTEIVPKESDIRPLVETTADASRRAIRKILSRVDSLLDISRMESGFINLDTKPTELATLVDSVCIELSPLAHELIIAIKTEIPEDMPLLAIDADKVERVLLNLLDNALKFAPMGSTVTIRARARSEKDGYSRTDVIDFGPGVPDEYKTRLFDRFVQVEGRSGKRRGSGLGLSFCRLVAEGHGGRIWIEDNPGGGSIFSMTLPLVNEEAVQSI
jgi:signal transduction histidine kinase